MKFFAYTCVVALLFTLQARAEDEEPEWEAPLVVSYRSHKLNLSGYFSKESSARQIAQKIVLRNLLKILYGNQPIFFKGDNTQAVWDLFDKVQKKGSLLTQSNQLHKAADLALISLRTDPMIQNHDQKAFYHILKGGRGELVHGLICKLESLCKYIELSASTNKILNVYLAHRNLLTALFEDSVAVNEILSCRKNLYTKLVINHSLPREEAEKLWKKKVEKSLSSTIDSSFLDFHIPDSQPAYR